MRLEAIPVSLPIVLPRSSSVLLDMLRDDEASGIGFMTPTMTVTHIRKNVSSELDTEHWEGLKKKLNFVAKHLSDR